jgi:hypothetical protein
MVKYLVNWTQQSDGCGGTERRYSLLKSAFPKAELVSVRSLATEDSSLDESRSIVDQFLIDNTTEKDIVIKDAGVGGTRSISAKTIIIYGNPYHSLLRTFTDADVADRWRELIRAQIQDGSFADLSIANSEFSKYDARQSNCKIDSVIPNGVDTDFWKPLTNAIPEYILWVGSKFKEQVIERKIDDLSFPLPLLKIYKEDQHSKKKMLRFYQHSACLVHTFPVEGNCNAVLEALSCDVPIVSTRSGWFWDKPMLKVGKMLPINKEKAESTIRFVVKNRFSYEPRRYIFDSGLTADNYISNMREVVKCLH